MTDNRVTENDFIALIAAYGGQSEKWPAEHRAAMLAFCDASPRAASLLGREARLDEWLDSLWPQADAKLEARLHSHMLEEFANMPAADIITLPTSAPSRRQTVSALIALAACFVGGFNIAPAALDMLSNGADVMASLNIISNVFLPTEPL